MYAIGVDSGTQGTKVLIVDYQNGKVVGKGYSAHSVIEGLDPGASEQDPAVWSEAMENAFGRALRLARINPKKIVSLGVSGQQHGFVPLDGKGRPIRPAKLWNDTSTIAETRELTARLGGKRNLIRMLGIHLAVGFTASKILWLKKHEPAHFEKLATVLLPHNFLNFHLTGRPHMEFGDASGSGLMDIRRLQWRKEALAAVDPRLGIKLPVLSHPREPVGYIRRSVASRFGLGRVLVSAGGGDNMMGAIGSGNVTPGVCTLSLGTSGTIYAYSKRPIVDPAGEIAAFCDSTGGWLPLLCTMNVTNTTEMIKSLFGLSNAGLEALSKKAEAGAGGLLFLPFVDGERVPDLPFSNAVFFGLNRKTFKASHIARATMEGTILNLGYGFSRMRRLGLNPEEIRATGGGSKSRLWLRIAADVFQTPIATLKEQESAAYGGALQSIWCYLLEKGDKTSMAEIASTYVRKKNPAVDPAPQNAAVYQELQERFNALWKTLISEFRTHHRALRSG